mmetsp:Transcript_63386/g.57104  ORF Transcript_63386/g.57104 Transcript_63386/m.57104 type:complete len:132 (-) Transcript_63386:158-553(-)
MNFKQGFMLFWSLSSGFGIIFAILSWLYDINEIKQDPFFVGFKGVLALFLGTIIGIIHYKISSNHCDKDVTSKQSNTTTTQESELQSIKIKISHINNKSNMNPMENEMSESPENSANSNSNESKSSFNHIS